MKKVKILVLLVLVAAATFYSCTDSNPVENQAVATKSIALRTTLNEIKKLTGVAGKSTISIQDQALCFNFVYPVTVSYNNGTQVTISNFNGLVDILTNENSTLYVDGIVFPFQVQSEGTVTTISTEAEFFALIQGCETFHTVNSYVFDFTCYSIVFPISVINANQETVTVNNQTELVQMVSPNAAGNVAYQLNIVFPISVTQNNQTIVVHDLYEFVALNNDCPASDCICTADYSPVCVQTANGIVEFSNACHAQCAGYTSADFVSCGGNTPSTFGQLLGSCFNIVYPVQIQYQGQLVTVHNDGECLQYWFPNQSAYPAFNYPLTISFATPTGTMTTTIANQAALEATINQHCN